MIMPRTLRAVTFALATAFTAAAVAGSHVYPLDATYKAECGSCHVAYPPMLLDAAGWQRVMDGLERHFGDNAILEPALHDRIARYLQGAAGRHAAPPGEPRLTGTNWFRREHDEVARAFALPSVRTPANCAACHPGAANGNYGERAIRVPRS